MAPGLATRVSATNSPCGSWAPRAVWTAGVGGCSTGCLSCFVVSLIRPPRVATTRIFFKTYYKYTHTCIV